MKKEQELLNRIHRNAQMGIETLPMLISRSHDVSFKNELREQVSEYQDFNRKAEKMMKEKGMRIKKLSPVSRLMATAMTNMKTMSDSSTSHLAELAIQGNNMGVTKITKALHHCETGHAEARALADQLLRTEDKNLRRLREYL